jgi:uncharacterized protein
MSYALVTGASKGIGKSIAAELAKKGYNLLLTARSEDLLKQVSDELQSTYGITCSYLSLDLSLPNAARQLADWVITHNFQLEVLVNNAGYGIGGPLQAHTMDENIAMMRVNMEVPVALCRHLLPLLQNQPKSYILNIASSAAYQSVPGLNVYAATKAFMLSFSRGLRQELRNKNVVVSCICPGATDTNFVNQAALGKKARKLADKVNMKAADVAAIAVKGMLNGKVEMVPGFINKLGVLLTWLLPKSILEKGAMRIYEP